MEDKKRPLKEHLLADVTVKWKGITVTVENMLNELRLVEELAVTHPTGQLVFLTTVILEMRAAPCWSLEIQQTVFSGHVFFQQDSTDKPSSANAAVVRKHGEVEFLHMVVQTLLTLKPFPTVCTVPSLFIRPMNNAHVALEVAGIPELAPTKFAHQFGLLRSMDDDVAVELGLAVELLATDVALQISDSLVDFCNVSLQSSRPLEPANIPLR